MRPMVAPGCRPLAEAGVVIADARFVTDSADDLPTASRAASVDLVHPSARSLARFRASGVAFRVVAGG